MTTGTIQNALGPNNTSSMSSSIADKTDLDLYNLAGEKIHDACVIEFDITTSSTQISFNYIFGSEEYPEFVGSRYNDVFAFYISGPGIAGKRNIALLPNSNTAVSINNVNQKRNSTYFHNNGDGVLQGGTIVQYDGYTVKLKAVANVLPCNTYHLKLAIGDVGDAQYDSGVFIETGSLSGNDAILIGDVLAPDSLHICASQLPIELKAGMDPLPNYTWTKNGTVVSTGNRLYDVNAAGWYKVRAYRDALCFWTDSIKISVDQDFVLSTSPDTAICLGASAPIDVIATGSSGYSYAWSPAASLNNTTITNPTATPVNTTTYQVTVKAGLCTHTANVTVTVFKPINLLVSSVFKGCINEGIQLSASGAENYSWSPGMYLNDSTLANPVATIPGNTTFTVLGYNACFHDQATVLVYASVKPPVKAYKDTTVCYGGTASLSSDYFSQYQYLWSPATGLSNPNSYNPTANPHRSQDYILSVDNNGCFKYDTVHVIVKEEVIAKISLPIKFGQVPWHLKLKNLSTGASNYTWYFTGFDSTKVTEPSLDITEENYYNVVLKAVNSIGCVDYDTIHLKAYKLFIPNLITPNGDDKNDNFEITGLGDQFSIEIYNRWGDRVYKKSHYRNEWNGEGLSDGVYFYIILDTVFDHTYKGWVQLMR